MTTATGSHPLRLAFGRDGEAATDASTGGRPPRRRTGPVLMGDIHAAPNGVPLLLLQWERWEREARDGDD